LLESATISDGRLLVPEPIEARPVIFSLDAPLPNGRLMRDIIADPSNSDPFEIVIRHERMAALKGWIWQTLDFTERKTLERLVDHQLDESATADALEVSLDHVQRTMQAIRAKAATSFASRPMFAHAPVITTCFSITVWHGLCSMTL
jgi:hypothetical protein